MKDKRLNNLLQLLSTKEYLTAEVLASQLKVSSKTIRNLIKILEKELINQGAHIDSKYGSGSKIIVKDFKKFEEFKDSYLKQYDNDLPGTSEERIRYLLEYLLYTKNYVKLDDLSECLYISKKTLAADLKVTEKLLKEYNLTLLRKPYYGIKVQGEEFNLRLCIANYIEENDLIRYIKFDAKEKNSTMGVIAKCVSECLREKEFSISDMSFENLIVHIYIAMKRIEDGHYVPLEQNHIEELLKQKEYKIAHEIVSKLKKNFNVDFPQSEIGYITIHLAGKKTYGNYNKGKSNLVISQNISNIVTEMLQTIYDVFKYDFRDNFELRMSLSQHIVPLDIRIKYDMNMKNPLLNEIKEKYALAYIMASQACSILSKHYNKQIKDDEIGYIALPIALALERQKTKINKKNILLVCSSGKGSAQLLLYKYKEEFGSYINNIETCEVNKIHKVDFTKIDYVFTTVPIHENVPVPIMEVQYFLEESDRRNVKKMLVHDMTIPIEKYYSDKLFITHMKHKNKEEALKYLCDYVIEKKGLPEYFYESVLKREKSAKTEFGNMVAMPHPQETISKETFVCIGILDNPILWEKQHIQVIFLVCVENNKNTDLQKFYQITSNFLLNSQCIKELIKKQDYKEFLKSLMKIEKEKEKENYGR
ncbi:BglG family transcription antiterminator [Clostridium sp. Marseille-Q2269]|uniref:BglG family transcription antiterminator n=1 Tax=Clostridium sp. Marseille-Q2269 TaxID=2942205 RepID=UPI002073F95F|nr:BglG family transcription antiterminator [Clostridium sp. Marseille-Q2269]